jgi:crotonobetainyl-CoA:carnitine CoA-transferase CaiB-like acyl-CoA transferase
MRIDPFTGCCLAVMVLAGLAHRALTGRGQKIVGSQFEAALQFGMVRAFEALNLGITPLPMGTEHPHVVPSRVYAVSDGSVAVTAETEQQWRDLCVAIGRPELMFDARFRTNSGRVEHRDALNLELEQQFASWSVAGLVDALQAHRVPAGPSLSQQQHLVDPHIGATQMLATVETHWGPITTPWTPAKFSLTPARVTPGPSLGQHTAEILAELQSGEGTR